MSIPKQPPPQIVTFKTGPQWSFVDAGLLIFIAVAAIGATIGIGVCCG